MGIATDIILLIVAAFGCGLLRQRLGQPVILGQVSRMLKRLWMHGFIKKVGSTYKFHITDLGRTLVTMGLKLRNLVVVPGLAAAT